MESMAQLRSLLWQSPSEEGFVEILKLFHHWRGSTTLDTGIAYAMAHLEAWPDVLRSVDCKVIWPNFPKGEPLAGCSLVRTLAFITPTNHFIQKPHEWLKLEGMKTLMESPHLQHLTGLRLIGHPLQTQHRELDPEPDRKQLLECLIYSNGLPRLQRLELSECYMDDEGMRLFAHSPLLRRLKSLKIQHGIGLFASQNGWNALAESNAMANLEELDLSSNNLGESIVRLVGSPYLKQLKALTLSDYSWGSGITKAVADANLPNLTSLAILNSNVDHKELSTLANSTCQNQLTALNLNGSKFGATGLEILMRFPCIPRLISLSLEGCGLFVKQPAVFASISFSALKTCRLNSNPIRGGLSALALAGGLQNLESLSLSSCELQGAGFAAFLQSRVFPKLTHLYLDDNYIDDKALTVMVSSNQLPQLRFLGLELNRISDAGAVALANSPHFSQLTTLLLDGCQLGDEGIRALNHSDHLPKLNKLSAKYSVF